METLRGRISSIQIYEEEGGHDWCLALSKVGWGLICFFFPISLFRFLNDFFGLAVAIVAMLTLLLMVRLVGPQNLVMLDEVLCRLFPFFRSAVRLGRVRVYDFRLWMEDGRRVACLLKGDLIGAVPVAGDRVTLEGRNRSGTFFVHRGLNEETRSLLAPRTLPSFWIMLGTIAGMILMVFYLLGIFDEVILRLIELFLISEE